MSKTISVVGKALGDDETPEEKAEVCFVPPYIKSVYPNLYFRPLLLKIFNTKFISDLSLFFYRNHLEKYIVSNYIREDTNILQMGATWGTLERKIAEKQNHFGRFHLEDCSALQIELKSKNLAPWEDAKAKHRDFTIPTPQPRLYNTIVCFFGLHLIPDSEKKKAIKRALTSLAPGGDAVFVDYAPIQKKNIFNSFIRAYNRLFHPFTDTLFECELQNLVQTSHLFTWTSKRFFGGLYQITTVTRSTSDIAITDKYNK
ncbi:MAG: class I SAM-dependent methyltransferase [Alphaproteobacteria bacterium]|nr:class I SAM-dependent methyltransferase [Alphaproteobacteria bacterium]